MRITLGELASRTGARLEGDPAVEVTGAAGLLEAGPGDVSFLENPKYADRVAASKAAAVFLPATAKLAAGGPANRLLSERPRWGYSQVLQMIHEDKWKPEPAGLSPKAEIHFEAKLGKDVAVGPFTVVRGRTLVGDRTRIGPNCHVGHNARIGKDCILHPGAYVGDYCELGDRVILQPGAVIGSDGYGYDTDMKTGRHEKIPQVGRVVLEDDVEVGANSTIDRAATGETRIGAGTKIDNLVQIGHNVVTGRNCLIISQVGLAGSTKVGHQVILAGQVGVAGHLSIGDGAVIGAQSGIMSDVPPKAVLFGSPARPHREAMKLQAIFSKLPELYGALKKSGLLRNLT
ncbi:MAG: UDP-3-O-(3-hydroxymyristoyl)glucosamine N-acyltransferase [Elusimicrobia bacterium]|nr:UDP-3-O-(3-hydroxymyristoyl)glucosamine N-acyltransferase [Elusimicrobiota bacterium]